MFSSLSGSFLCCLVPAYFWDHVLCCCFCFSSGEISQVLVSLAPLKNQRQMLVRRPVDSVLCSELSMFLFWGISCSRVWASLKGRTGGLRPGGDARRHLEGRPCAPLGLCAPWGPSLLGPVRSWRVYLVPPLLVNKFCQDKDEVLFTTVP